MRTCFITFRSVTFAQRGERLLKSKGVSCVLQRAPGWMEERGCGYALKLGAAEADRAAALLREHQVPARRVYVQNPEGALEERAL